MRRDLDTAFQRAHGEVATVIRDLQRGGVDARDAARAREKLLAIAAQSRAVEAEAERDSEPAPGEARFDAIDWRNAKPGDRVFVRGGGAGTLVSLPDRRGRVGVQVGGARIVVPADRIGSQRDETNHGKPRPRKSAHVSIETRASAGDHAGGIERCDLRGLRVEAAVAQIADVLDRAALRGCSRVHVVHGLGTGALRDAIRAYLAGSPYVERAESGHPDAGGEGVTEVVLR
jgi:DNA mismatch repair protein MutS2